LDSKSATLLNAAEEHRLIYPRGMVAPEDRAFWLLSEFERIFHHYTDIGKSVVKISEYGRSDSKGTRATAYADAVIFLACKRAGVPVLGKTYASLKTKSGDVLSFAEENVGKTSTYWDKQMADAVAAAWHGRH
tara:strand:- start:60104 stop:60502 length:399 start_codon:yes stop_codon:yes gene_type:complete